MLKNFAKRVDRALQSITPLDEHPKVGLILGSGLGGVSDRMEGREISYSDISEFPKPTVEGHTGILKIGSGAAVLSGRFHYYEGYSIDDVVLPIFLLRGLGIKTLIITNAAGGVNRNFSPGDLILIKDHINLMGINPLYGRNHDQFGPRFPDMSNAYPASLRKLANRAGKGKLQEGVYAAFQGPSYETPAEVQMAEKLGADLVGMSTVPEVIAANYLGMNVLGISCVTNMAAGVLDAPLCHEEVVETGRKVQPVFVQLISGVLDLLADSE